MFRDRVLQAVWLNYIPSIISQPLIRLIKVSASMRRSAASFSRMLVLSESDVRRCLPIDLAIAATRKALGEVRSAGDGGATVPPRIGIPYRREMKSGGNGGPGDSAEDWTLFKPAAYNPRSLPYSGEAGEQCNDNESIMGMKLVSVRGGNPALGLPTVPASVMLVDCETGQMSTLMGGTYLTAARTAAGSAVAADFCIANKLDRPLHLTVFGAGLQGEMHIEAMRAVRQSIGSITIVNRSASRANDLVRLMRAKEGQNRLDPIEIDVVALGDRESVQHAVRRADIICTATNTTTPLFDGAWVKPGTFLSGVGSYTAFMEEIDSKFIQSRCLVVADTIEALQVGDLRLISNRSENFVGLLGDVISGRVSIDLVGENVVNNLDCALFKSVGTAIQDVVTAQEVYKEAMRTGIGSTLDMT